ncbi:MAG: hypothetical protein J2P36_02720 [Ktedonobacteraceae bacterium]|nr:hypothetical protein [Ktedonobacteraceae bacterium]
MKDTGSDVREVLGASPHEGISQAQVFALDQRYDRAMGELRARVDNAMQLLGEHPLSDSDFALILKQHTQENRDYHGMLHAIQMGNMSETEKTQFARDVGISDPARMERLEARINVAGAFHDNVYLQVDGDVSPEVKVILGQYVDVQSAPGDEPGTYNQQSTYRLKPAEGLTEAQQKVYHIVSRTFGIDPRDSEKPLPPLKDGPFLNEFLSTLVAADTMKRSGANDADIAQVATMIEGTIPFRNEHHFHELAGRLAATNEALGLGMSEADRNLAVKAATFIANKDVLAFVGSTDLSTAGLDLPPGERLRNQLQTTWNLVPELNPVVFRDTEGGYMATAFREGLLGRRDFEAHFFTPEDRQIFHQYDGYPRPDDFSRLKDLERSVRDDAVSYLEAKIVSAALVEALAVKSGAGRAPVPELVGGDMSKFRLDSGAETADSSDPVFNALKYGRGGSSSFDIPDSPIAARIIETARIPATDSEPEKTGMAAVNHLYTQFLNDKEQFHSTDNQRNSTAFLIAVKDAIGEDVFRQITGAMEEVALESGNEGRATRLRDVADRVIQSSALQGGASMS